MWASRWAVLCCLLCLAASSSSSSSSASTCSWQELHEEEFTTQPHQITVRANKDGQSGSMNVSVVQNDTKTSSSNIIISPSSLHTLNLSCSYTSCGFKIRPDEGNQSQQYLVMTGFKKFIVKGHGNMEWSKGNCTETDDKTEGTNGTSQTSDDIDDEPELWVLALIAAGVAVTVASISVFVWSLCGTCTSEREG